MLGGLLGIIGLGLLWTAVGVIQTRVAKGGGIAAFYAVGTPLVAILALPLVDWSQVSVAQLAEPALLAVAVAGAINAGGQQLMIHAMRRGHRGLSWAIGQSAMVWPFVAAVLIWGEQPGLIGWLAISLLLIGLVLSARPTGARLGPAWVAVALCSWLAIGIGQVCFALPSQMGGAITAGLRTPVALSAAAVVHITVCLLTGQRPSRRDARLALLWSVVALAAFGLLFATLDSLATVGRTGIVFPLATATTIAAFALYSRLRLHESLGRGQTIGLATILLGALGIALHLGMGA